MNRKSILNLALIVFAAMGCNTLSDEIIPSDQIVFHAISEVSTKVVLQDNLSVAWNPGDAISVFAYNSSNNKIIHAKYVSANSKISAEADFKGSLDGYSYSNNDRFYAVSPYNVNNVFQDGKLLVRLPSEQVATAGSFDPSCFISAAVSDGLTLRFRNICGGVRVFVRQEGVKSIVLESLDRNNLLCGTVEVSIDDNSISFSDIVDGSPSITLNAPDNTTLTPNQWYYLTSLPTSFWQGYKLTYLDGQGNEILRKVVHSNEIRISRSVWGSLEEKEAHEEIQDNEIWYTTSDGKMLDYGNEHFVDEVLAMPELLYNTYSNGIGKLVYESPVYNIQAGTFMAKGNLKSVILPECVKIIGTYAFSECRNLESINFPDSIEGIESFAFKSTGFTELTIDNLDEISTTLFYECDKLKELTIGESVRKIGSGAFSGANNLERITILSSIPPEGAQGMLDTENNNCIISIPEGSKDAYFSALYWDKYRGRMRIIGDDLKPLYDRSTDYSRDGEVMLLQTAKKGSGINIVFMGDGFLDRDLEPGGKYEQRVRRDMEIFFSFEPYKSLRDRFNVYAIKFVSEVDVYDCGDANHKFVVQYADGNYTIATGAAQMYASQLIPDASDIPTFCIITCNSREFVVQVSIAYPFLNVCFITSPAPQTLVHEMGHLLGRLADEYVSAGFGQIFENKNQIIESHGNLESLNVDWTNSPENVAWKDFLSDSRYSSEDLGIFEGALQYSYGVFRPSRTSVMQGGFYEYVIDMNEIPPVEVVFNAPSRSAIYRHVMMLTEGVDWKYDYEKFVEFDAAGRAQAAEVFSKRQL